MLKDTKSLGNNKAPACESRRFVHKKRGVHYDTPPCTKIVAKKAVMNLLSDFFGDVQKIYTFEPENSRDDKTLYVLLIKSELATFWLQRKKGCFKEL